MGLAPGEVAKCLDALDLSAPLLLPALVAGPFLKPRPETSLPKVLTCSGLDRMLIRTPCRVNGKPCGSESFSRSSREVDRRGALMLHLPRAKLIQAPDQIPAFRLVLDQRQRFFVARPGSHASGAALEIGAGGMQKIVSAQA